MKNYFRIKSLKYTVLGMFLVNSIYGQVSSKELIEKARAMGVPESQIQQELAKQSVSGRKNQNKIIDIEEKRDTSRMEPQDIPSIEKQREDNLSSDNLQDIVFGREIFSEKNLTFSPDLNIPTPRNYILSAGDELIVNVWGDSELNLRLIVSPDGTVLIPNLGPILVSGLTVATAEDCLRKELTRIMSTLSGESNGVGDTYVSVNLGRIRSIKVNIVGEVIAPGTYTIPSFSTLFNALYAAGGVNSIGTLRNVKVYRNSKEVASLDVYDYLLNGKYDTNIRLEENDMIMVGPYERLVVVRGEVKRNRIFELKKGETLGQLLNMAGGFTGNAYKKDVRVKRKSEVLYQIATVKDSQYSNFLMQDGDSLFVDSIIPFYENRLTILGAVWRPGEYELSSSVHTIKQLVEQAAGLKGDEFTGRAQLTRLNPDFTTTMIAVDIRGILNGTSPDIELKREDILNIPSLLELREPYTIRVSGAVLYSDTVIPYRRNMTVEDAVMLAGGLKEAASAVNVEVARRIKDEYATESTSQIAEVFTFSLSDNLEIANGDTIFTLEPFDEVNVRYSPGYQEQQSVKLQGEVLYSGNYVLETKNARLSDIVKKAGGITPYAYTKGASLKRKLTLDELQRMEALLQLSDANKQSLDSLNISMKDIKDYSVGIDLEKALAKPGSVDDLILRDGDELYIPQLQSTVKISGAVNYPNSVTYEKNMSIKDCLNQSGGYNDLSRKYPVVVYMNGKVSTTKKVMIFFKKYPKVEPGCEIIVPTKTKRERTSLAEVLSIGSSATSMAAMITSIINTLSK